jgi:hypothetical protein
VHYGRSGHKNGDALFFMLGWDWYGFNKKRDGTDYAELVFFILWVMYCIPVRQRRKTAIHYF